MAGKLVIANWKSMKTLSESKRSLVDISERLPHPTSSRVLVALSPVALALASELELSGIEIIAQDLSSYPPGAHTGQTTVEQLLELGVKGSIVGHSERRKECGESDSVVVSKLTHAFKQGLEVVFCFGEDLEDRQEGRTEEVLGRQLTPLLEALRGEDLSSERLIFAYEPV